MSDLKRKRPDRRADHKTQAGNEKGTIERKHLIEYNDKAFKR